MTRAAPGEDRNTSNYDSITVWWTGPCGAVHVATDPVLPVIGTCPDGLAEGKW